nr:MAG TPA: SpoVG [Caudoviricetes sp.]
MFNKLSVRVRESNFDGNIAFGSVTIDDSFAFNIIVRHNPKSVVGGSPWFISFPQHKSKKGEFKDDAFPVTKEARAAIYNAVKEELLRSNLI